MYNSTSLPLERKKIIKKTLESFPIILAIAAISGLSVVMSYLILESVLWWLLIIAIIIPFISIFGIYIYQTYYYKLYFYDFKEGSAEIKKGVISQSTGHVRYERIQNIYIDQDILDRIFGLYDVHYETAGETSGIYSHVDGLNKKNSDKLVEFLNNQLYGGNKTANQGISKSADNSGGASLNATGEVIDRNVTPISKKIIIKDTIVTTLLSVLIILGGFGELMSGDDGIKISGGTMITISLAFIALAFVGSLIYNKIWFKNFHFQFADNSGIIKSQVIALSSTYVYYDRIQNINVTQGILERIFGLFSVTIETAAESSAKDKKGGLRIPGLAKADAEKIKNFLLAKVDIYKNKL